MGTSWSWSVVFSRGSLTAEIVEHVLVRAGEAGLSVHRPDGAINSFSLADGHREVDRRELVDGLVGERLITNLWPRSGGDIGLSTQRSFGVGPPKLALSIDAGVPRPPAPHAHEFRRVHRKLTKLWLRLLRELGADFGRVDDEWSIEQVWRLIPEPVTLAPPPPDRWPFPMGWWTFVDAERTRRLPELPPWLGRTRRTPGGGTLVALTDDPTMIDVLEYEDLHLRLLGRSRSGREQT
jgi:hypothetical protein